MAEILRNEELTEQLLDNLLQWMTNTNATRELTSLEGICSGRQVAQVLSTLVPSFFGETLADIANIDDDDIPVQQKEHNHELIARKLGDYFQAHRKYIDASELWRIVPSEIAINQNKEKIVRLIIIVVAVVVFSGHKSYTTSLMNNPPELQAQISALVKDFDESTRVITNGDANPNEINKYKVTAERFKARVMELEKENASLTAKNQNLREENEHLEQEVKAVVEEKLRNNEAAQKQRHLESQIAELGAQMRKAEERISEMEVENDGLRTRNEELEQEHEDLMIIQREVKEENDAFAQKNAELVREVSRVQKQLEQVTQKESHSARTKNYENELLQKRISSLVQELSQHESIRDQYETLKTLHQNAQRQMDTLKEKLEETTSRANSAETEVMSLKKHIKRLKEQAATAEAAPSSPNCSTVSDVPSLHDELNGSMTYLNRRDSVETNYVEVSELRTRLELLENENARLNEELEETRKLLEKAQNATDSKLVSQRTQSEYMGQEKDRLQREIDSLKSRDAANTSKIRKLEESLEERNSFVAKLEETLDRARFVIETITTSAGGVPSPVEVMELRNENQQLQQQNESLTQHLDRFQHMSTQEQRLITTKFAQQQLALARLTHGPGFSSETRRRFNTDAPSTSSASGTPSVAPPDPQFRPPSAASSQGSGKRRSFLARQYEASNLR
ncbi:Protein Hook like protein 2 [Aphelenchoides avenae]|nr:Protein Hook like protein 2 [Aphelenchus avenae]